MFFYPDQFPYQGQSAYRQTPPPPHPGHPAHPAHPGAHPSAHPGHPGAHPGHPSRSVPAFSDPFAQVMPEYLFGPGVQQVAPSARPSESHRPPACPPPRWVAALNGESERFAQDEDELEALRVFRASKQREAERAKAAREAALKRKAEAERRAKEIAQREHDARVRAQVEANARAAAREYVRRKQARQNAINLAQKEQRERQQHALLEQLCRQFGLFTIPGTASQDEDEDVPENAAENANEISENTKEEDVDENAAEDADPTVEDVTDRIAQAAQASNDETASKSKQQANPIDPIRALIEALSPYPIIFSTESSEEEGDDESRPQPSAGTTNFGSQGYSANTVEEPETVEQPENDLLNDEPTCETVTEDGIDDYEARDPEIVDITETANPAAAADPTHPKHPHHRKHRHKRGRKGPEQQQQQAPTHEDVHGIISALGDEFNRVNESYKLLANEPSTDNLQKVITRVEGVKICFSRSEDIYTKLDEIRAPKSLRKDKQRITSEAVSLADKCEELLQTLEQQKAELRAKQRAENPSPDSKHHHVTLEEVEDEDED